MGLSVRSGLWILVWIGMYCSEIMVLLVKFSLEELYGIMGGLLGIPSEDRMGGTSVGQW